MKLPVAYTLGQTGNHAVVVGVCNVAVPDDVDPGIRNIPALINSLGPGIPDLGEAFATTRNCHRHQVAPDSKVVARSVLGGLHHEYRLERIAA
jgi:hypothetical protein